MTGLEAHGAGALYTRIINEFPSLEKVMSVYDSWRAKVPEVVLKDETYVDPKSVLQPYDHDGDYNNQTKSGHGDGYRLTALSQDDKDSDGEGDSDDHDDRSGPPRTRSFTAAEQDGKGVMSGRGGPGKRGNQKAGKQGNQKTGKQKVPSESLWKVLSDSSTYNQQLLSEAALSRFNEQIGGAPQTSEQIHQWSKASQNGPLTKRRKLGPNGL